MGLLDNVLQAIARVAKPSRRPVRAEPSRRRPLAEPGSATPHAGYPGDFRGRPRLVYAPEPGSTAEPGEICWTWVPFEEDHTRGKDRPVLIIGRDDAWLLGLGLTSKDHDLDRDQEAAEGRYWVEIGTGGWDQDGRVSEVRVNRIIRIDPGQVRRVAGRLDQATFETVAAEVRRHLDARS